ncbi:HD domain-containing protein [Ilumatobacter sp.]|uniref:HD domain-containing protein n=1 Tax=Ilumatobacter sp. TaxID=1967498 RepID=UPI003B520C24
MSTTHDITDRSAGAPGFDGPIGSSMAEFSTDYMTYVEGHLDDDLARVGERMMRLLRSMDELHQGFAVSQLQHALQTATRAERDGADDDMIIASLCHDVGKTFSNMNHPAIAAEMLRPWVSDEAYWVVRYHQDFQGRHYYERIGMDPELRRAHLGHEHYDTAERFADVWDQTAFDPDYDTSPLEHFEPLVREVFSRRPRRG